MTSPNRGEYLFNLLSSLPVFNNLDFVRVNDDASVSFKKGGSDIRVKMDQADGGQWVYDAWMSEGDDETHSQRSYIVDELIKFIENVYYLRQP